MKVAGGQGKLEWTVPDARGTNRQKKKRKKKIIDLESSTPIRPMANPRYRKPQKCLGQRIQDEETNKTKLVEKKQRR